MAPPRPVSDERPVGTRKAALALPAVAAVVSIALYSPQATELFSLGLSNYEWGLPLAGLLFVWVFVGLRRQELTALLNARRWNPVLVAVGAAMVVAPYPVLLVLRPYPFALADAGVAIATCWVGVMVVLEPNALRFLLPYLGAYGAAVGTATVLDTIAGDPLAYAVADVGKAMTSLSGLQVHWSAVVFSFSAAGGTSMSLLITQECSGTVSVSLLLLLVGLMYLDMGGRPRTTLAYAAGGALLFVFLNALRVYTMTIGGIFVGPDLFWNLHQWVGYAYYAAGYSLIIVLYTRSRGAADGAVHAQPGAETPLQRLGPGTALAPEAAVEASWRAPGRDSATRRQGLI